MLNLSNALSNDLNVYAAIFREPRSETIDLSIIDHELTFGDHDPWAVRYSDFSVRGEPCENQQSKDDVEREQLVRDV